MSEVWQTSNGMWRDFIDADAALVVGGQPPLDELDNSVVQALGAAGFLGGLEETTVSTAAPDGVDAAGTPANGAADSGEFDSMTTMVRSGLPAEEEPTVATAAPTAPSAPMNRAEIPAVPASVAESAAANTEPLQVGIEVPEQGLEVGLEPTSQGAPAADPTPRGGGDVDGLYIPALTKPDEPAPAVPAAVGPQVETERVTPAEPPPAQASPPTSEIAEAPRQPEPAAPQTPPARSGGTLPPIAPESEPEPQPPVAASGGTLVPPPESPPESRAVAPTPGPAASGGTLVPPPEAGSPPRTPTPVVATPGPSTSGGTLVPVAPSEAAPPPSPAPMPPSPPRPITPGGTVVGPAPTAPEPPPPAPTAPEPRAAEPSSQTVSPDQSAASSQTAGEIVTRFDAAAESTTAGQIYDEDEDEDLLPSASSSGSKIIIATPAADNDAEEVDAEEVDADDILEADAPAAPQAEPAPGGDAPPTPPPTPPKAKAKEGKPPPAPPQTPPPQTPPPQAAAPAPNETASALAGLAAERTGGTAANLERAAERAEKTGAWYETAFGEHFAALGRPNHARLAKAEVDFFLQASGLNPGARVLDVGCGDGAHSLVLAQRGFSVTGFDNSLPQLLRATQANEALAAGAIFVHGDMRDPPVEGTFDGILCVGSTLGYFDEADNRNVFRKLREHLAPGGRMLIQCFNRDHVISRLPTRSWWQGHGCQVLDEVQMNYFTNRLRIKRAIVFEDGRQFEHVISIRAYSAHELGAMCVEHGLRIVEISGSRLTRGRFYGATSPEIWLTVSPK